MLHQGGVESLESCQALDLLEDGFDLLEFELEGFQLLVKEIADPDDIGNSARIVAGNNLPAEAAQAAGMAERLKRVMQKGRIGERLRGNAGITAEFGRQGRRALAVRVFGGIVVAHRVNTIRRCVARAVKVQMVV